MQVQSPLQEKQTWPRALAAASGPGAALEAWKRCCRKITQHGAPHQPERVGTLETPLHREMMAFFSCLAWRAITSPLSKVKRRLDSLEATQGAYFCFIDYAKAFDCVDHNKLWKILNRGIGGVRPVAPPTWLVSNFLVRPASS